MTATNPNVEKVVSAITLLSFLIATAKGAINTPAYQDTVAEIFNGIAQVIFATASDNSLYASGCMLNSYTNASLDSLDNVRIYINDDDARLEVMNAIFSDMLRECEVVKNAILKNN